MATLKTLDDPDLYTIGWIAALPIERAAAIAMLDERHDKPLRFVQHQVDLNSYTWGKIGEHNIVITSLPAGLDGTTSAAVTASNLLSSLPQIKIALLVGIGGGIPQPDRDIRLGDIAVSQPQGTTGGVVQYDLGKAKSNQIWERKGYLSMPPRILLNALAALQAEHESGESRVAEFLGSTRKLKKGVNGYSHQGFANDRLFKPSYSHIGGRGCRDCDVEGRVERDERDDTDPEVHYGTIASGNTLVKDAATRDKIANDLGECICFEMEAAGLMNHFPCLVIRGICDYADSHKNDQWQRYASITAAAYAKDLLGYVPAIELCETQRALDVLKSIGQDIETIHMGLEKLESDNQMGRLTKWLDLPDVSINLNEALKKRQEGTCFWFLQNETFEEWKTGKRQHLWLQGIPGCGKTVLSAAIAENLTTQQHDPSCVVLIFYFDFNDSKKQSLNKLVCSLVTQMYSRCPSCRVDLDMLFLSCESGARQPTDKALFGTFLQMMKHVERIQIILDALDECETRGDLLSWIGDLLNSDHAGLHLLATSRKEEEIESELTRWLDPNNIISIQQHTVNQDIRMHVREKLRNDRGFLRWHLKPDVLDEVETELMRKADGMFRWAACQLDDLKKCLNLRTLRNSLRSLPTTLEETYARILANIEKEYRQDALTLLQFLTYSERPLTLEEAVDAIAVDLDCYPSFDPMLRMPQPREILRVCSSLVSLVSRKDGDDTVEELQLAHFTVQQYLESDQIQKALSQEDLEFASKFQTGLMRATAKGILARTCLAYLSQLDGSMTINEIQTEFPLARYSAQYWIDHAKYSESAEIVRESIVEFFLHQTQAYAAWGKLFDPDQPWKGPLWWPEKEMATPLYYACLAGLKHTVSLLLENGAAIDVQGGTYNNALQAASSIGDTVIVQQLLDHGANANIQGGLYGNALQAASIRGHKVIVQQLLAGGSNVNLKGGLYSDALYAASSEGHLEIVHLLLDKGAHVNAQGGLDANALMHTPFQDHEGIVQHLLARAANTKLRGELGSDKSSTTMAESYDVIMQRFLDERGITTTHDELYDNVLHAALIQCRKETIQVLDGWKRSVRFFGVMIATGDGSTPVGIASFKGNKEVVQLLLDKGAEINAVTRDRTTPLFMACSEGHLPTVQLLLERGACINIAQDHGWSPLFCALFHGHMHIFRILLEKGADVNTITKDEMMPLLMASFKGHTEVVQLLLEKGANINAATKDGTTPLLHASSNGHTEVVKLLLEKGANINAASKDGMTPLLHASIKGHLPTIQLLLKRGANVNMAQDYGFSPLICAAQNGHVKAVILLLDQGADINAANKGAMTALSTASSRGHLPTVQLLLERGACVDVPQDYSYWSPLYWALFHGHIDVFRILLEHDSDVSFTTSDGFTPLLYTAEKGYLEAASLLLEKGADIESKMNKGYSSLAIASQHGHIEVVRLLLTKGADIESTTDEGWSSLVVAVQQSQTRITSLLIDNGACVNSLDRNGKSSLVHASAKGCTELVSLLLDNGADINASIDGGWNPLIFASQNGHIDVARLLLRNAAHIVNKGRDERTPLWLASIWGHIEIVRLLLESGADMTIAPREGSTPLWVASEKGNAEIVRILLERGADVTIGHRDGRTPLYVACQTGSVEIALELIQYGADITVRNKDQWTPINEASFKGHIQIVQLLLDLGVDINVKGDYGRTPLFLASRRGHTEVVRLLIERGADLTIGHDNGRTPLDVAREHGHVEIVEIMLGQETSMYAEKEAV
ncbi:hypothetical protein N7454_006041 [Penicillium verhagenii]|nr:hypothetical protein N7454_006041 [Penicillium verhagenii]